MELPGSGIEPHVSCIGRQILYHWAAWEAPREFFKTRKGDAQTGRTANAWVSSTPGHWFIHSGYQRTFPGWLLCVRHHTRFWEIKIEIKKIESLHHVGLRGIPADGIRKWEEAKAKRKSYLANGVPCQSPLRLSNWDCNKSQARERTRNQIIHHFAFTPFLVLIEGGELCNMNSPCWSGVAASLW